MRSLIISIIFLAALLLNSCENNPLYIDGVAGELVGSWIDPTYVDTLQTFRRASFIPDDKPGWLFNKDGTLINRTNTGWCGTPPISYEDYRGEWSENDSIVDINVGFWGGYVLMEWEIISITETELTLYIRRQETLFEE